jgi:hypothetical protein
MSAEDIGPGDVVECVDNKARLGRIFHPTDELAIGARYTVLRVGVGAFNEPAAELVEVRRVNWPETWGYALFRFRKIGPGRGEIAGLFAEDLGYADLSEKSLERVLEMIKEEMEDA